MRATIIAAFTFKETHVHTVGILTGRKKTSFSHFCILVIHYSIRTKFDTELPASQESLHSNLKEIVPAISQIRTAKVSGFFLGGDYSTERNGTERNGMMD